MTFAGDDKNDPTRRYRQQSIECSSDEAGEKADQRTSHPRPNTARLPGGSQLRQVNQSHCAQLRLILLLSPRLQHRKQRPLQPRLESRQVTQLAQAMTSFRGIRPMMDPHFHYGHEVMAAPTYHDDPYSNAQMQMMQQPNQLDPSYQDPLSRRYSRRYSSPQMGYYDLITGEYRYRSSADQQNQSPLPSSYQGEMEPPMCENTCACCQVQIPFNWLTICLITSLMLLLMFSIFKLLLGSKDYSKSPNKNQTTAAVNMSLFQDMIWLMSGLTLLFVLLTILRYTCFNQTSLDCDRCRLVQAMRETTGNVHSKRSIYSHSVQNNQYAMDGEDFV